jgi:glutathione synthase/RimK-type ligase-like ATP-grasp enzyme
VRAALRAPAALPLLRVLPTSRSSLVTKDGPMILIMTGHRADPTVELLERTLSDRGADVLTIDAAALEHARIGVPFTLDVSQRGGCSVSIDDVSAAFLWRSTAPNAHDTRLDAIRDDPNALGFVLAQWSKLSRGLWHALEYAGVFCVNPATSVAMWEDKLTQLVVAGEVGLPTPVTRYLCDLHAAADFADAHGGQVVYKPFTPYLGPPRVDGHITELYSQVVSSSELRAQAGDDLVATPGIFQPYVDKAFELRVVYVGGTIFACRIESQRSTVADKDWRRYDMANTPHLVHRLDGSVERKIGELMRRMNLRFGSLDFIVTPEGEHVFLEVNPVGQFGWIVDQTGLPIYERLAELLIERA